MPVGPVPSPAEPPAAEAGAGGGSAAAPLELLSDEALLVRLRRYALGSPPPGLVAEAAAHRDVQARATAELARLDAQPERIPRRPQLLPALMRATSNGDASIKAITALVQQDPTLIGNVLRMANSAYYRVPGRPLESVERAITRLGTEGMRRIVAATLLQPVTDAGRGAFAGFAPVAWAHSLASAAAAAQYASRAGAGLASTAHMVALVHGLGSIVVMQLVRDEYARRPQLVPDPDVAAALLGHSGAAAARIAAAWELPAAVLEALDAGASEVADLSPLARSLRMGRVIAAATMLVRNGTLDDASALASLAAIDTDGAAPGILQRLLAADDAG